MVLWLMSMYPRVSLVEGMRIVVGEISGIFRVRVNSNKALSLLFSLSVT